MNILFPLVQQALEPILSSMGLKVDDWIEHLQSSREPTQGDLTLPCFPFAKILRRNPNEIAEEIASALTECEGIEECISVNGYVNFRASMQWLFDHLDRYQQTSIEPKDVLIEHTSANPNGPFHVGRARNAILGDTLVRLHRLAGHTVTAEYYVDDMGKQVAVLAWALEHLSAEDVERILEDREPPSELWSDKSDHQRVRWYQAAQLLRQESEQKEEIEAKITQYVHASENGDEDVLDQFSNAYQPVLDGMLDTLARLGIQFDRFTKESMFVINGDVSRLIQQLKATDLHNEAENGAFFLDLGQRGLEGKTDFYYCRGDGSSLYATRDIAYHLWKWTTASHLVNILGEDHKLQAKQVGLTLEELKSKAPEVVFYSFIKLPDGKMSTRQGNVVFMDDLLEEARHRAADVVKELRPDYEQPKINSIAEAVGTAAVRFNIIKVSPEKGFIFKWEDALAFEADSAPFVMYAHTRACSIQRRVTELGIHDHEEHLVLPEHIPLGCSHFLRTIMQFRDALETSVNEHRPHVFANYMLQLATAYHAFYRDCHVIDDGRVNAVYYRISEMGRQALFNGLNALGLAALETM